MSRRDPQDRMHARIGDSYLAKSVRGRFEDLRNFTSRISLAEYMAGPAAGPGTRLARPCPEASGAEIREGPDASELRAPAVGVPASCWTQDCLILPILNA